MHFFSVPFDEPYRSLWINAIENIQQFDHSKSNYHVCSLHFLDEDLYVNGKRKTVIRGRIPSIFLCQNQHKLPNSLNLVEEVVIENLNPDVENVSRSAQIEQASLEYEIVPVKSDSTLTDCDYNEDENISYLFVNTERDEIIGNIVDSNITSKSSE